MFQHGQWILVMGFACLALSCQFIGPLIDPMPSTEESTSEATVILDESVADPRNTENPTVEFEATDPVQLLDLDTTYTIELGRFPTQLEAELYARSLPLLRSEMGIACVGEPEKSAPEFLLAYGVYHSKADADTQLRVIETNLATTFKIERLTTIETLSKHRGCLSTQ